MIGDDILCGQSVPDTIRISKLQKSLFVLLIHIELTVLPDPCVIWKTAPLGDLVQVIRISAVTDRLIGVDIHMVYTAVIRRHGRDHTVQVLLVLLLGKELFSDV